MACKLYLKEKEGGQGEKKKKIKKVKERLAKKGYEGAPGVLVLFFVFICMLVTRICLLCENSLSCFCSVYISIWMLYRSRKIILKKKIQSKWGCCFFLVIT